MKLYRLLSIILFLSFHQILYAEDKQVFSLEEAKEYALKNSKDIALQQVEVNKSKLKVKEALSRLLPQVNGELTYTHYGKLMSTIIPEGLFPGLPEQAIQFGMPENINVGINATQTLFNGVFLVGLKASNIIVQMAEQEKVIQEEDLKNEISRSYYNVLVAKESTEIVAKNIENLETLLKRTENLYNNGLAKEIDVDRLRLSLANLETQVNSLQNNVELTELALKFLMAYPIDQDIALSQSLSDFVDEELKAFPKQGDFTQRKELHLFDLREQGALANIKVFKSEYYPYLTAFGSLASSAQRDKFSFFRFGDRYPWYNVRYAGVQLNLPIWDSFGRRSRLNTAKEDLQRIRIGREKLKESFDMIYGKARIDYANAVNEYNNTKRNMALAEKIYKVSQKNYMAGVGSSIEMTNAERELYTSQANLINAMYKVLIAKTDIDKALGEN